VDLFIQKQKISKAEIPVRVERVLLCNSIVLNGGSPSFGFLNPDKSKNDDIPFTAGKISTLLLCAIEQIIFLGEEASWFTSPVPKSVPNYHQLIKEPMDLGTIKDKIESGELISSTTVEGLQSLIKECLRLLELVWINAQTFNPPKHMIHKLAVQLNQKSARVMANVLFLWQVTREEVKKNGLKDFWSRIPTSLQDVEIFNKDATLPPPPSPAKRSASTMENSTKVTKGHSANDPKPGKKKKRPRTAVVTQETASTKEDDSEATDSSGSAPEKDKNSKNGSRFTTAVRGRPGSGNNNVNLKLAALRKDVNTLIQRIDKVEKVFNSILRDKSKVAL